MSCSSTPRRRSRRCSSTPPGGGATAAPGDAPATATGLADRLPAATGLVAGLLAASCCLLPIALIAAGVAGAGVMMTMMQYEWLTLPLGVVGLAAAYGIYFRSRRRCDTTGCRFVGRRMNQVMLAVATALGAVALLLKVFPSWAAAILRRL